MFFRSLFFMTFVVMGCFWESGLADDIDQAPEAHEVQDFEHFFQYESEAYLNEITKRAPVSLDNDVLRKKVDELIQQKLWQQAKDVCEEWIASGPETGDQPFFKLAMIWSNISGGFDRAVSASYLAFLSAKTNKDKARAFANIGEYSEKDQDWQQAIYAYEKSLSFHEDRSVRLRLEILENQHGFKVQEIKVNTKQSNPLICIHFNQAVTTAPDRLMDFIQISPAIDAQPFVDGHAICMRGGAFGQSYEIKIREGLMGGDGKPMRKGWVQSVTIPDRQASVWFQGNRFVLQAHDRLIPMHFVNTTKASLKLFRITDRNAIQMLPSRLANPMYDYETYDLESDQGRLLWQGSVELDSSTRNQESKVALDAREWLPDPKPGIYVLVAQPIIPKDGDQKNPEQENWDYGPLATQWFVITDLGLTAANAENGLYVQVRSLKTAETIKDAKVQLIARDNEILSEAKADRHGSVRFDPGLLRGVDGAEPYALYAFGEGGDFSILELTKPAFDFSDRGVKGRTSPKGADAFVYSDRGVYRPGEVVHVTALFRDHNGKAIEGQPLGFKILRPDRVVMHNSTLEQGKTGGFQLDYALSPSAKSGSWEVQVFSDPNSDPIGHAWFEVQDYVPLRIEAKLETQDPVLKSGATQNISFSGQYLYGSPAADLQLETEWVVAVNPDGLKGFPGYHFGLVQEKFDPKRFGVELKTTDQDGKSLINLDVPDFPETNHLLMATIRTTVFDLAGSAVQSTLPLLVDTGRPLIGIKPMFDQTVAEGQNAEFEIVATDVYEKKKKLRGVQAKLIRENWNFQWLFKNQWQSKLVITDDVIEEKTIDIDDTQKNLLSFGPLDWGHYRLELVHAETKSATSVRFASGWALGGTMAETPDQVRLTAQQNHLEVGNKVKLEFESAFSGYGTLWIAHHDIIDSKNFEVKKGNNAISMPVEESWGVGAYAVVTLYRPIGKDDGKLANLLPKRAFGVLWLPIDTKDRQLKVEIQHPEVIVPRQGLEVPLKIQGLEKKQKAFVTLAAVDEGVLQLTHFQSPNPTDFYFGQKKLNVDWRDIYAKLIDNDAEKLGKLRVGGDAMAAMDRQGTNLIRSFKTIASFSGIVETNDQGEAVVPINIPDFQGQVRLMAVAYNATQLGQGDSKLKVRDPVVMDAYMPRFLAKGDRVHIPVEIKNLDGQDGQYEWAVEATGVLKTSIPAQSFALSKGQGRTIHILAETSEVGEGGIRLKLQGPDGQTLSRDWSLSVRTPYPRQTDVSWSILKPGESLNIQNAEWSGYEPDTLSANLMLSAHSQWNAKKLWADLESYPYGCMEQTLSKLLPVLYFKDLEARWGIKTKTDPVQGVQDVLYDLMNRQSNNGSFTWWGNNGGSYDLWITAFAVDVLGRAKDQGYRVPDLVMEQALQWLKNRLDTFGGEPHEIMGKAYALYVLAKNKATTIGQLRYFQDNVLPELKSRLAYGWIGAGLSVMGDTARSAQAFDKAVKMDDTQQLGALNDFGSPLRDHAWLLVLISESLGAENAAVPALAHQIATQFQRQKWTSTQEKTWLVMAALRISSPDKTTFAVEWNGKEQTFVQSLDLDWKADAGQQVLKNKSLVPLHVAKVFDGVPISAPAASQHGFVIERQYYDLEGRPISTQNPVRLNDLMVVVIQGRSTENMNHQTLVVDLLPAGLEVENPSLGQGRSVEDWNWLPPLDIPTHVERKDDRFLAAIELTPGKNAFAVAYLARATATGVFVHPPAMVEDMYHPEWRASGSYTTLEIVPSKLGQPKTIP